MSGPLSAPPLVGLWVVAVLSAAAVLISPITPWLVPVETVGLATCLITSTGLAVWFVRH
jgi:hypothetical protein